MHVCERVPSSPICVRLAWRCRPHAFSWEHMLCVLAGLSVLGSSPDRGGGGGKTRGSTVVTGYGDA